MKKSASRRQFLKAAAVGGAAVVAAQTVGAEPLSATAAAGPKPEPLINRMSRTLGELVQQKFATHELGGQMREIEQDIVSNLQSAQALARLPLQNSDEPDFIFVPE